MGTYAQLLGNMAKVVGGSQPDATNKPYWYSGKETGDGSGVPGLAGCWWPPPEIIEDTPVALIIPGNTKLVQPRPVQGQKVIQDTVQVRLLAGHSDLASMTLLVAAFHDLVPSAFDAHMQLFGASNVLAATCDGPDWLEVEWSGNTYIALEFEVRVERVLPVTYTG